jgi:hypothetical protein
LIDRLSRNDALMALAPAHDGLKDDNATRNLLEQLDLQPEPLRANLRDMGFSGLGSPADDQLKHGARAEARRTLERVERWLRQGA